MIARVKSTKILQTYSNFIPLISLSPALALHVDESKSSQSYRVIYSSKNLEELSRFLGVESANGNFFPLGCA